MNRIIFAIILALAISGFVIAEEEIVDGIRYIGPSPMAAPSANEQAMEAYNRGSYLMRENILEEAEKHLKEAIELDPLFVDAMDHLGIVYRRQGRYDEAEEMYLKSIATNSENPVPYQNLAVVYRLQGRLNDALGLYQKMIALDSENPEPYYGIGELFYIVDDYEKSIAFFNAAIQRYLAKNSNLVYDALHYQGMNYYYFQRYDEALQYLKEVQKANPGNETLNAIIDEIESIKGSM
jgi:tetratricopeptide (TPR) repeat protein